MKKIKFSELYDKLLFIRHDKPVRLVQVFKMDSRKLSKPFIEYDTQYLVNDDGVGVVKYYPLPLGTILVLLFLDCEGVPFTTVRTKTGRYGDKEEYYRGAIGEEFEVVFTKTRDS